MLLDDPQIKGGPSPLAGQTPTWGQTFSASFANGLQDTSVASALQLGAYHTMKDYGDPLTEDQYKQSPYFRQGLYEPGMTTALAAVKAGDYDNSQRRNYVASQGATSAHIVGGFTGGAFDPLYYIPFVDEVAPALKMAEMASRGEIVGRTLTQSLNAMSATALAQPLVASASNARGENYDLHDAAMSVFFAGLGGGAFGALDAKLGLLYKDRVAALQKAGDDIQMGRQVDVGSVINAPTQATKDDWASIAKGELPQGWTGEELDHDGQRAYSLGGRSNLAPDDQAFLDSYGQDGGKSYYKQRIADTQDSYDRVQAGRYFKSAYDDDHEAAATEYRRRFKNVISADDAKELSPEYAESKESRTKYAADVHETASDIAKDAYKQILSEPVPEGKDPVVVFTAGGSGAGKTTALRANADTGTMLDRANAIYDTNLSSMPSALRKINQALDAGRSVNILYVHRDPIKSLTEGVLPRAERTGRVVSIDEHVPRHQGALETIHALQKHFQGDDRVRIQAIDNTRGSGQQSVVPVASLPQGIDNDAYEKAAQALDAAHQSGAVSDAIYDRTRGRMGEAGGSDSGGHAQADAQGLASQLGYLRQRLAAIENPAPDYSPTGPEYKPPVEADLSGLPLTDADKAHLEKVKQQADVLKAQADGLRVGASCYVRE